MSGMWKRSHGRTSEAPPERKGRKTDMFVLQQPRHIPTLRIGASALNGPLEADEFHTHSFARTGPLNLTGFPNSGADWLDRFKPYIEDGKTIIVSPHKVWGPQTNDLTLQLRKPGISRSFSAACWRTSA